MRNYSLIFQLSNKFNTHSKTRWQITFSIVSSFHSRVYNMIIKLEIQSFSSPLIKKLLADGCEVIEIVNESHENSSFFHFPISYSNHKLIIILFVFHCNRIE